MNTAAVAQCACTVLIVEDEMIIAWSLQQSLERFGCTVSGIAATADAAVALARNCLPDLIIMDIRLEGPKSGIEAAQEIRSFSSAAIVFLSGNTAHEANPAIKALKPLGIYSKPLNDVALEEILALVSESGPEI
jgi:DNA-binding NarL/FixJ family response regulator